jgi:hypothetical protein
MYATPPMMAPVEVPCPADQHREDDLHVPVGVDEARRHVAVVQDRQGAGEPGEPPGNDERAPLVEERVVSEEPGPGLVLLDRPEQDAEGRGGQPFQQVEVRTRQKRENPKITVLSWTSKNPTLLKWADIPSSPPVYFEKAIRRGNTRSG